MYSITHVGWGSLSLTLGLLWTNEMNAWLSLTGSRHSHTVPLNFSMNTKLLHYYAILFFHIFLKTLLFVVLVIFPILSWRVLVACRLWTLVVLGGILHNLLTAMKMYTWKSQCLKRHQQILDVLTLLVCSSILVCLPVESCMEISYFTVVFDNVNHIIF